MSVIEQIGVWSYRRRWLVLVSSVAMLIALWAVATAAGDEFRQSFTFPGSETQAAADRLADAGFPDIGAYWGTAVIEAESGIDDPQVRTAAEALIDAIAREVEGVTVLSPFHQGQEHQVAPGGRIAYASLHFSGSGHGDALTRATRVAELRDELTLPPGVRIELGGDLFVEDADFSSGAFGLIAAAVILLIAFGSLLAMGLPIVTALLGIACGVAVVQIATGWFVIPPFAPAAVGMIGIGVGVDYALFIVTRYREELAAGRDPASAVGRAIATAGRAAVFAGATTVLSLLGLFAIVGINDVRALALAIAAGVIFVMLASITLLPALIGFAGRYIDRFGLPHRARSEADNVERSVWYRWSRVLQRRPVPALLVSLAALISLSLPAASMELGLADPGTRPETDTSRRAYDVLAEGFGPGSNGPLIVALSVPASTPDGAFDALPGSLAQTPGVSRATSLVFNETSDVAFLTVIPETGQQEPATRQLVQHLRDVVLPEALEGTGADALVGGAAAAAVDFAEYNERTLPLFIGVVLLLCFGLLVVLFKSLLVPLKAVLVNLLSVGAAYGVLVAVFQWGWLGLVQPGPIEAWVPMMLFAIVFGLSIDYEVFLLSRIRERYLATGDNSLAVADGLARTARVISAAAAIMVCVFVAFALSTDRALQMLGLGLAVAIAADATIVRLVLVPATMELAGTWNWWMPSWLARVLPGGPGDAARMAPSRH